MKHRFIKQDCLAQAHVREPRALSDLVLAVRKESEKWIERRTRQSVLTAARNAKFPSSLTQTDPSTAEIAGPRDGRREAEDTRSQC